jgi:hypothetical protein
MEIDVFLSGERHPDAKPDIWQALRSAPFPPGTI